VWPWGTPPGNARPKARLAGYDQFLSIAFWDQAEFFAYSHREIEMKRLTKSISWVDEVDFLGGLFVLPGLVSTGRPGEQGKAI
jgi:hypothetical protein